MTVTQKTGNKWNAIRAYEILIVKFLLTTVAASIIIKITKGVAGKRLAQKILVK
jgi:hypothetical protein